MEITSSRMVKPVPHPLVGEKVALTIFDSAAADAFCTDPPYVDATRRSTFSTRLLAGAFDHSNT
jgi:hypothetical protein